MSHCLNLGVRAFSVATVAAMLFLGSSAASAQTTLVLDAPDTEVTDAYIRGGSNAAAVFNTDALATKANSNVSNVRRALLKFDTETRIPRGSTIQSARLTLTLKKTDPSTRTIGVYRVTQSFQESQATWTTRKSGYRWTSSGGDLSSRITQFSIGTTVGTKVTVDVTSLVRSTVAGSYGSRYTRLALVDTGSSSDYSYKEFYSSESSDSSKRPTLTVVYGTASAPAPTTTSTSRLKVLEWNTHYGAGTDGVYNIDRIATKIASYNPDLIALTEVTRRAYYSPSTDDGPRYAALLKSKTGRTWYHYYRTDNGASAGVGNLVLSRFPIASTSYCQLSTRRVAVNVAVNVNGRIINFWSTHLDSATGNSLRLSEVSHLKACLSTFAEQRIIAGDFNAQATSTEITQMKALNYDGWAEATADNTEIDYPGNTRPGATRNSRIDYIFYSKGASRLILRGAQVFDTRDSRGVMPSDHKPVMLTFDVK
jgi:endonuclease/exonuclease/phosphatase family metal-dependent hydrolase